MDDETLRIGPAITIECPWCEQRVELAAGATSIECVECRVVVELADDRPAMASAA